MSVSIYVRYIWLRTEVAARSTHIRTHRQARAHGHYTLTNSTKSNRSAQLLSGTHRRAHTHGEYATLSRCERVEPTRANESREAQQNAQKYSAQRRSRTTNADADCDCDSGGQRQPNWESARVSYIRSWPGATALKHSPSLSFSRLCSLFVFSFCFFACSQNKHSINVCLGLSCGLQLPDRVRVGSYRLSKFAIDWSNEFHSNNLLLPSAHRAKHNGIESAIMVNGNYMKCLKTHSMDIIK